MAVLHVVLLDPAPEATDERLAALWDAIRGLRDAIPGIERVDCGPSVSPEGLEQGFTQGFVMRFADSAARDAYLPHPAHLAVVPLVREVSRRVLVFDLDA